MDLLSKNRMGVHINNFNKIRFLRSLRATLMNLYGFEAKEELGSNTLSQMGGKVAQVKHQLWVALESEKLK